MNAPIIPQQPYTAAKSLKGLACCAAVGSYSEEQRAQETHTTLPHTFSLVKKPLLEVIFLNANGMLIKTHIE